MVRPPGGLAMSSSRARWTSVPFEAQGEGGSGRRSMTEKRKARGHDLKAEILLGDSVVGSGRLICREGTSGQ